jgi:hypothetical protein
MGLLCKNKQRFATKADAEATIRELAWHDHPLRTRKLKPYFCNVHGCFHVGHSSLAPGVPQRPPNWTTGEALGRLYSLRASLIMSYGQTRDPRDWQGVRALSGAIKHLSR